MLNPFSSDFAGGRMSLAAYNEVYLSMLCSPRSNQAALDGQLNAGNGAHQDGLPPSPHRMDGRAFVFSDRDVFIGPSISGSSLSLRSVRSWMENWPINPDDVVAVASLDFPEQFFMVSCSHSEAACRLTVAGRYGLQGPDG